MAVDIDTPVAAIEGIGPSIASALETIRVYTVFDLLRRPSQKLHDAVGSHASHAEVGSWRAMASLLQVAEMTPQWAEALALGGIDTIDELQRRTLTEVQEVFERGGEEGLIAVTPSADQIAEMQKDASAIRYSGLVMGTILDPTQQVVQGATLRIGHIEGRTDARGRFRLLRVRLGYDTPLLVQHPDYRGLVVEHPRVTPDADVIDIQVLRFMALAAGSTPSGVAGLSELHGDLVPVPYGVAIRQIHKGESELQAGDILMVREFYASDGDIELVSRLRSYENGEVLVRTFRVPGSRLPGEVKVRDHFRYTGSEFVPIAMSSRALQAYKLRLRLEKAFAGTPEPHTLEERKADFEARLSFFLEHYPFVRPRNAP